MKRLYRYHGMSGTFKGATIKSLLQGNKLGYTLAVWSMIKPWKKLEDSAFQGLIRKGNNMDLAAMYLCTLENTLRQAAVDPDIEIILSERGVLDNLFYWSKLESVNLPADYIQSVILRVREEEKQLEERFGFTEMRNTVLVMEDEEFIENHILSEPTRRAWFPDVKTYLSKQEEYLKFIFRYGGDKIYERRILNARDYIENKLKMTYNV